MTVENFQIKPAFESECTLLGGFILDNNKFELLKNKLCPEDFSDENHQIIFKAMTVLYEKHKCFDPPMLMDYLEPPLNTGIILELVNSCCSTNNLSAHADIILEKSVQRQLIECTKGIKNESDK